MFFVVGDRIPKIKFTYFNGRGLGELSRLILAQAGVEFEDQRLTPDEWKKLKSSKWIDDFTKIQNSIIISELFLATPPPHQVPLLDFDGFKISQSITIARFLAKIYSLDGKSILEKAQADMIVDFMVEIKIKCRNNPNFKTEILPEAMKMFEKFLESNDNKFFVGNEVLHK